MVSAEAEFDTPELLGGFPMPDFSVGEATTDVSFTRLTWRESLFQKTMTAQHKDSACSGTPRRFTSRAQPKASITRAPEANGMTARFQMGGSAPRNNRRLGSQRRRQSQSIPVHIDAPLQTVEPKADRVGIAIEIVDELRERLLGSQLSDDLERHTSRACEDFDYVLERWRIEPSHNVRASEASRLDEKIESWS